MDEFYDCSNSVFASHQRSPHRAIAKATAVKLLSRNLRDFRLVPGLDVEDWTT